MEIALASDHGGYALKEQLKEYLLSDENVNAVDCGCFSTESCDYPDFGAKATYCVVDKQCDLAIVVCTSGVGMSIACNKVKGARCALCLNTDMAHFARLHNNANVLALGAKYTDFETAKAIVNEFLTTQFEGGGRHTRRVEKISALEEK